MAIWDRFKRNKQESVLPDEVKQYYQSEKRQKRGVAIGLAVLAVLVTVAIAAGLFFGGRFVYNKIKGNDKKESPASQSDSNTSPTQGSISENKPNEAPKPSPQSAPKPSPQPAPAPSPPPASSNPTTPALGDSPLPRTGDEGM